MRVFECSIMQAELIIYSVRVRGRCVARVGLVLGLKLIENHPQTMKCFVISDFEKYQSRTKTCTIAGAGGVFECSSMQPNLIIYSGRVRRRCLACVGVV